MAVRDNSSSRPRRADAQRNIEAIVTAARDCLVADPGATLADIARAAGVGRITLYGHFPTRAELVEAVLARVVADCDAALANTPTSGSPAEALARLVSASWRMVDQFRSVLAAAEGELDPQVIRAHNEPNLKRISTIIGRGQRAGDFRRDLSRQWLVTLCYSVMHAAATEVTQGRMKAADVDRVITATLLGVLAPPASA